jgi:hypothetical protein
MVQHARLELDADHLDIAEIAREHGMTARTDDVTRLHRPARGRLAERAAIETGAEIEDHFGIAVRQVQLLLAC